MNWKDNIVPWAILGAPILGLLLYGLSAGGSNVWVVILGVLALAWYVAVIVLLVLIYRAVRKK